MSAAMTLFQLASDGISLFDGSVTGVPLTPSGTVKIARTTTGVQVSGGNVAIGRHSELDGLQSFTIDATITPTTVVGARQTIIEGQTPGVTLFIDPSGKLVGQVHTASGWVGVDSGTSLMKAATSQRVVMTRDANGQMTLLFGNAQVGAAPSAGPMQPAGTLGLRVGAGADGNSAPFNGSIAAVDIRQGVVPPQVLDTFVQQAAQLRQAVINAGHLKQISVSLLPDESHARLQHVKDLMNAAGVQSLSDLSTLPITQKTPLQCGQILVAPRKSTVVTVNWATIASSLRAASMTDKRQVLATSMPNRNSVQFLSKLATAAVATKPTTVTAPTAPAKTVAPVGVAPVKVSPVVVSPVGVSPVGVSPVKVSPVTVSPVLTRATTATVSPLLATRAATTLATPAAAIRVAAAVTPAATPAVVTPALSVAATSTALSGATLSTSTALRSTTALRNVSELVSVSNNQVTHIDPALLTALNADHPALWPIFTTPQPIVLYDLTVVPLNSAVVIASTLDLTNEQLVVEPNVETLYIIAETVICGANAAITWRRPGGTTPGMADNPDLNGRGFPGIQTKQDSRDGIDGGNGDPGVAGITGAGGRSAPNIEMWVKSMTGMPNLDFAGENGIPGGGGERGGSGGRGGGGSGGKRIWFFGWDCVSDPGDGGDGGNGGRGGDGGRGGNGGNGGNISIGVLTGTLANTVVNQTFKLKNQGGAIGPGGPGGQGGAGGAGGRSGNGETCTSAKDGHTGAQGQPGSQGSFGAGGGGDGSVTFFEFTQAAWDDMMTRPWITSLTPPEAFPGDTMTIQGSRFTTADHAVIGSNTIALTINPDESASVVLPANLAGGVQPVFVRRADGIESNRVDVGIKPQLATLPAMLAQGSTVTLNGHAFLAGAAVLFNGAIITANVTSPTALSFAVPGTGGGGSTGGTVSVQVRNPDGRVSNLRSATQPRILEIPFRYGQNNLSFPNFTTGLPDWGTYEDTFGAIEVMHEALDPIFGDPVLTAAYFAFYVYFLKGTGGGGLATGFCTALASLVADRFWLGKTDTPTVQLADVQKMLTGVHGKLLSRQALLTFHAQGREGLTRVEETFHQIEATFLSGTDRQNAPLLFFIPSGEVWDSGYTDKLSNSHCVMPYRIVYPVGRPAPQLTPDGTSTLTDPDGCQLFVWDCNNPTSPNCRVQFRRTNGQIAFDYIPDTANPEFTAEQGITLGMMRHGDYMLADVDLPFSGPFGLTAFVIEFLLSPADIEVTDVDGKRTGNFSGKLMSEIPGSHLAYLMKGMYLLPAATALTRTIVGNGVGTYDYHSITPDGTSLQFEGVPTQPGHRDTVSISADSTQIRFTPAVDKPFSVTIARLINGQARAVSVHGLSGGPQAAVDVTLSPELNVLTIGNRGAARNVDVKALAVVKAGTPVNKSLSSVALAANSDLAVTITDWTAVDLQATAVPFS